MMLHSIDKRPPSGSMELGYEHSRSGGEWLGVYETNTLRAEGESVVLVVDTTESDAHKSGPSNSTKKYKIDPMELAELIKTLGESV